MPDLPRGTVTFLFTDIEGSTRLWELDPAAMWTALARHHDLLRSAILAHHGVAFKTVGDAFQAAFASAPDAVAAAADAQRTLAAAGWPETGRILVRMAIHSGEAEPDGSGGDYTAPCLNRLARLLGAAHGGQTVLTGAARALVEERLPSGVSLKDLGRHRLRDLLEPERVTQVDIAGLPSTFPPLKSLERHPTNLPVQPTALIGRGGELAAIAELFGRDGARLVTLNGPGGAGKTRLALQAAADLLDAWEDGAFFVDLAPLFDPGLLLSAVAQALGVREGGGQTVRDALTGHLGGKRILLILDNFERVAAAAPDVADLLASCPRLGVIVTSRAPLRIRAEREVVVDPFGVPDLRRLPAIGVLAVVPAIDLFVQRARAAQRDFRLTPGNADDVAAICVALDGLPLAIELAAARIRLLTPAAMRVRLERRLALLTGGARDLPERQRTLRAAIAWSRDLLSPAERTLFAQLSVFSGGCTLEAAEAVAGGGGSGPLGLSSLEPPTLDGLSALVEQSLLRQREDAEGQPRFTVLATIREFAQECLAGLGGEADLAHERHAAHFLGMVQTAAPLLTGETQADWLNRLETEHDNLRTALGWVERSGDDEAFLAGVAALWRFWWMRGHLVEGREWLARALARTDGRATPVRARALSGAGVLAQAHGDCGHARALHEEALGLHRRFDDEEGVASALSHLGLVAADEGDYPLAEERFQESLALDRRLGNGRAVCVELSNLGMVAFLRQDAGRAAELYDDALRVARPLGDSQLLANILVNLAEAAEHQGDGPRALPLYDEALALYRTLGDRQRSAFALAGLGRIAGNRGDLAGSAAMATESLALAWEIGDRAAAATAIEGLAAVAVGECAHARAAELSGAAAALREAANAPIPAAYRDDGERRLAALRSALGDGFTAAWNAGRALPPEQAVRAALAVATYRTEPTGP